MLRAGLGLVLLTAFLLVGALVLPLVGGVSVKGAVAQETRSVIAGTVTDSSGQPVARMWIKAEASETSEQSLTTRDGAFGIRVADGEYRLKIYSDRFSTCTVSGYENPESRWDAPFIIGGNDVTGIHVSVGGIPGEFSVWTPCRFDVPSTRIQGVATNDAGRPVARTWVSAVALGDSLGKAGGQWTASDGGFALPAIEGLYRLRVVSSEFSSCTVSGHENPHLATDALLTVAGEDVTNIRITLAGSYREGSGWISCKSEVVTAMVTSELHPGLNLAAWTEAEASVDAIFEAIPQLGVLYAWDGENQRFRWAVDDGFTRHGDLKLLVPGMGLWLFIVGETKISWERPLVAPAALVEVNEGWNLVGWGGSDGITLEEALDGHAEHFREVWRLDPEQQWSKWHSSEPHQGPSAPPRLTRGDAFWLHSTAKTRWLQPGWPTPQVRFLGDVQADRETRLRRTVAAAQAFYANRFGVVTSDFAFYFSNDRESLVSTYKQITGQEPRRGFCGGIRSGVVLIDLSICLPISHEYFHIIQQNLSNDRHLRIPRWLVEGSAVYADFQRRYSNGRASYLDQYHFMWASEGTTISSENTHSIKGADAQWLGYIAMEWLAAEAGEQSIIDYFAALGATPDWEAVFEQAFGLSIGDFYVEFEEYRHRAAPPFSWDIQGIVHDRHGTPVEGIYVSPAKYFNGTPSGGVYETTASDGSFNFVNVPGSDYVLMLHATCPNGKFVTVGAFAEAGFTTDWRNAPTFKGEDQDRMGIVITLPITMEEFEQDRC